MNQPPARSTSRTLLENLQSGDPDAWNELVYIYNPIVYRWCRKAGLSPEDAKDVGQAVFIRVSKTFNKFERQRTGSFRAWLRVILQRSLADHLEKQKRMLQSPQGGTQNMNMLNSVADLAVDEDEEDSEQAEAADILHRILDRAEQDFTKRTWSAFKSVVVDRAEISETAAALNMTDHAVRQAKYRVQKHIREKYGDFLEAH